MIKILCILILFAGSISGCTTDNYAINTNTTDLEYRTYYYGDKDREFDFHTVLYSHKGKIDNFTNYIGFVVRIDHLHRDYHARNSEYLYSKIRFQGIRDVDLKINYSSIKISHTDSNGNIIPSLRINSGENSNNKSDYASVYSTVYSTIDFPEKVTEHIYVEFTVNEKKVIIETAYPIEKVPHYSTWDALMGV